MSVNVYFKNTSNGSSKQFVQKVFRVAVMTKSCTFVLSAIIDSYTVRQQCSKFPLIAPQIHPLTNNYTTIDDIFITETNRVELFGAPYSLADISFFGL